MAGYVRECKRNISSVESSASSFSKKLKILHLPSALHDDSLTHALDFERRATHGFFPLSPATSSNSGCFLAGTFCSGESPDSSCCSSNINESNEGFVDLEAEGFETESLTTCINNNKFSTTSQNDTECMDSSTAEACQRNLPAAKKPTQAEIDEFFAAAEKEEQKRFADKYNYDVVKDAPLEGRYQWVRIDEAK